MKRIIYDIANALSSVFFNDDSVQSPDGEVYSYAEYLESRSDNMTYDQPTSFPAIDIILYSDVGKGSATVASCMGQGYGNIELHVFGTDYAYSDSRIHSLGNIAPRDYTVNLRGDYVLYLREGDILQNRAFERLILSFERNEGADAVYSDSDTLIKGKRQNPHFKPQYSPDTLLSCNYIGRPLMLSRELYVKIGGIGGFTPTDEYEYVLRAAFGADYAVRADECLLSVTDSASHSQHGQIKKMLTDNLSLIHREGYAVDGLYDGSYHVHYTPGRQSVHIILYNAGDASHLREWMEITDDVTESGSYRVTVASADTGDAATRRYETALCNSGAARVLRFSRDEPLPIILNSCVKSADADLIIFCDCGVYPTSSDWITEMAELAAQEHTGTVSPLILTPDKRIMGAGNVAGTDGWWDVPYYNRVRTYNDRVMNEYINTVRNVSLCDVNCFMLPQDAYYKAGGFDESFCGKAAFVDMCIRLSDMHYRHVYTPFSQMQGVPEPFNSPDEDDEIRAYDVIRPLLMHSDPCYSRAYDPACTVPTLSAEPLRAVELNPVYRRQ